jgi:hypothetical protein
VIDWATSREHFRDLPFVPWPHARSALIPDAARRDKITNAGLKNRRMLACVDEQYLARCWAGPTLSLRYGSYEGPDSKSGAFQLLTMIGGTKSKLSVLAAFPARPALVPLWCFQLPGDLLCLAFFCEHINF